MEGQIAMLNQLRDKWINLGRNNQIILVATSVTSLIALVGFLFWANAPEYTILFDNLSPKDANAISDKLKEQGVAYKLGSGGTTLSVPVQKRDELRLKLISEGLPAETANAPAADEKSSFMNPPEKERSIALKSTERDISKSINTLKPVVSSIVHIAAGDDSPFASQKTEASASVVLTVRPGYSLTPENVHAIMRLTQMSYTGLREDKISVVDSQGNQLYDPTKTGIDISSDRAKQEKTLGESKRVELQSTVDKVLGAGKAVVMVNLELNGDQVKTTTHEVTPGATTQKVTSEEVLQGNPPPTTAPGTNANTPGNNTGTPVYNQGNQNGAGNYTNKQTTSTNLPSHSETETIKAPGRIEKLTVSALIDDKIPASQVDALRQTLLTAIGGSPSDVSRIVTVSQVSFDRSVEQNAAKVSSEALQSERMKSMLATLVPLVLMVLCLILLGRALNKASKVRYGSQFALAGAGGATLALEQGGARLEGSTSQGRGGQDYEEGEAVVMEISGRRGSGSQPSGEMVIDDGMVEVPMDMLANIGSSQEEEYELYLESIMHLVKSKPENVSALIRTWISEGA